MKTTTKSIEQLLLTKDSPLPLDVIPNKMGINLCNVSALTWTRQNDGQLVDFIIHFKPNNKKDEETKCTCGPTDKCSNCSKDTDQAHFCTSACGKLTIGPYCNWCGAAQKVKINDDGPICGFSSDLEWLEYLKWKAQQHKLVLEVDTDYLGLKYLGALLFQCDNNEKGLIKIDVYLMGFEVAYNINASPPMFATFEKFKSEPLRNLNPRK